MIIKSINSEIDHHSLSFIKRSFNKIIDAEYITKIDEDLSENVIVFTGIADPTKLISSIKNKNKRIVRSFILSDHQEINEKLAKKILEQSEKNNADILTTEKDSVRLLGYNEVSFKNKLLLKSNIVNLNVKADVEIIINDIEDSLNLSKI